MKRKIIFMASVVMLGLFITAFLALLLVPRLIVYSSMYGIADEQDADDAGNLALFVRQNFRL